MRRVLIRPLTSSTSQLLRRTLQSVFGTDGGPGPGHDEDRHESKSTSRPGVTLRNVRVPQSVLAASAPNGHEVDKEGLVLTSVHIANGQFGPVPHYDSDRPQKKQQQRQTVTVIDCGGTVALPLFHDPHTHLIKTHTTLRERNGRGTMDEAVRAEARDRPRWSYAEDVRTRLHFALRCAYHYGTYGLRTHLDGVDDTSTPDEVDLILDVFDDAVAHYSGTVSRSSRSMVLQGVLNLDLVQWSDPHTGPRHAQLASRHDHLLLGAYCGGRPLNNTYPTNEVENYFDAVYRLAAEYGRDVDFHMDETNDPYCLHILPCLQALLRARSYFHGRVTLGHCCSLTAPLPPSSSSLQQSPSSSPSSSLQLQQSRSEVIQEVVDLANACGGVAVVANPWTNLYLQDRQGQTDERGLPIPHRDSPRTPTWRGLTALQELDAGGVLVAAASDNVCDYWNPYGGDYDGLANWKLAVQCAHLDTAPHEGHWAGLCTVQAAQVMGLDEGPSGLARLGTVGRDANLMLFPGARHIHELFSRPPTGRVVLRQGVWTETSLPDYDELDGLEGM